MTRTAGQYEQIRVLPLNGGSNFRDIGGYRSDDGRTVRWGQMFRSGAMINLTDADIEYLEKRGLRTTLDLRCRAERELAPSRWSTPRLHAIDYPTELVFAKALGSEALQLYRAFPRLLAPHMGWLFNALREEAAPVVVHCSGGQDRTGVVMGVLLAALGVSKEQIAEDYMLTTSLRRKENELSLERVIVMANTNPVAAFYKKIVEERGADALAPRPLLEGGGRPKIMLAFDTIDEQWGGLERFLYDECGLDEVGIDELRNKYLE